jgi:cell division septation protein DedD
VIATRRLGRARHEFRFGGRELLVLGAVSCLVAGLLFAGGVLVGREFGRKGAARADAVRELGRRDPDGARSETPAKTAATRTEEKVTFYRTLTAPEPELPQAVKPTIEEHLVPKDEAAPRTPAHAVAPASSGAPAAGVVEAPEASPAPERVTPPALPTPKAAEPARLPRPVRAAKAAPVRPAPAQLTAAPAPSSPDVWTVQVSAFRSRALAEELRSRLAARGFDAYVFPSITEDGRPRYRVRVGTYASRVDAERAAGDLRSERGLNPLVTPRTTR